MKANIVTVVSDTLIVARSLRHPGIKLMPVIFPIANTDPKADVPASAALAAQAMKSAQDAGLLQDDLEVAKFLAAGHAISNTIGRTESVIRSLSDPENQRYIVSSGVWTAQLPLLRRIDIVDVTQFQKTYQELNLTRANYNVVLRQTIDYLDAVKRLFAPQDMMITQAKFAYVLANERQYFSIVLKYLPELVKEMSNVIELQKQIQTASCAPWCGTRGRPASPMSAAAMAPIHAAPA